MTPLAEQRSPVRVRPGRYDAGRVIHSSAEEKNLMSLTLRALQASPVLGPLLRHSAHSRTIQEPRTQSVFLRHSARSRGIQESRTQSVLQAFLDAATARSMTGVCAPRDVAVLTA